MSLFPVIERELRAKARRPFNSWRRVMGGGAITLAFAWLLTLAVGPVTADAGLRVFCDDRKNSGRICLCAPCYPTRSRFCGAIPPKSLF
jgi:hypothetical protein